ncbi:hypothetical protein RhiirC2_782990 [Rhizophagus irregularis]|uniref:Uncharacterized protein n=1 Tax=Rhizophagus irregularis TaxID=588596 RepID=A0A2N1N1W0_9GLOM|nr:hypothetical protein RhiirC2_782990 [Rhizophagus irregularis]
MEGWKKRILQRGTKIRSGGLLNFEEQKPKDSSPGVFVELAEQVFGANHARGKLANEINDWHPTLVSVHENIKQSYVEHEHGGHWNAPNYQVEDVICIDMKECYPASMRGQGECSPWFKQFGHLTHHLVRVAVEGELPPNDITGFAQWRRMWEDKRLDTYCTSTISSQSSCAIIGKFTQGNKVEEKRLIHRVVIDEGELDFLIQDCIKEGTYASSDKYPLEHILTFSSNEVGGADTSKFQCSHKIPSCAMCEAEVFYSKEAVKEFAKEVKKNTQPSKVVTKESEPLKEEKIREIQPGQWHDKGEKIHGPDPNVVYWPKNRHWESIKNITESIAPSIHDPITRSRVSYLNGGGGSGKTTRTIRIFKDINIIVFTHTNALAKDFQNDREWTPERMGEKKFSQVVIRVQSDLFHEALPVTEKWKYLEGEWKPSDCILSVHLLFQRIAFQKCLELHQAKYSNVPIPLIYRLRDGHKQNCLVQISSSSEKKELVKNDIIHLPLNTLSDKFLQDMLGKEKAIDWELEYAMTIHTSQGMTLKSPQRVWVIDKNLAWDNLIYLAVGRVEYLSQLIRVEAPPLPPEIAQEIEEAKKKRRLEHELRPSIQEKLIRYMGQDKKKGCEFDLTVDYILTLKRIQDILPSVIDF